MGRLHHQHRRHACVVLSVLLLATLVPRASAYLEEVIVSDGAGFQVGPIVHEVATNQVVLLVTLSASMNTIPILYMSKPGWDTATPQSDNLKKHPCESGSLANSICCVNALIDDYQVAPSVRSMFDNAGICPYDPATETWAVNYTGPSVDNPQLNSHMMVEALRDNDFLSTSSERVARSVSTNSTDGNGTMTLTTLTEYLNVLSYPDNVAYTVLREDQGMFTVELRLNHLYLESRSRKTESAATYGGISKYEFYVGVTFVKLLDYTKGVAISTAQVTFDYFKSDFVFMSIATEQEATPVQQFDIVLHESKSLDDFNLYQYMQLDIEVDRAAYPYPPVIKPDSLRWLKNSSFQDVDSSMWSYPCETSMGYYATTDHAALDAFSTQTCLPVPPTFCRFDDDNNFFVPFPTAEANTALGFIPGADEVNDLYLQFTLELTDTSGFKHISTVFASVDLRAWPVLQHCQDTEFYYKDVTDALQITATMGIKARKDSAAVLEQTTTLNREVAQIAGNPDSPARRLLSSSDGGGTGSVALLPARRLLQDAADGEAPACDSPVCGYGRGQDSSSVCTEEGTYECEKCEDASLVIDPYSYKTASFSCSWALCTVHFEGDKWKSWGTSYNYQQFGMYPVHPWMDNVGIYPVGDGEIISFKDEGKTELARMSYADWGVDPEGIPRKARIYKAMGPVNAVVVFEDNTISHWGGDDSDVPSEYKSSAQPTKPSRFYAGNYRPIKLPLGEGESIVDLCAGRPGPQQNGLYFLALTDENRVFRVAGTWRSADVTIDLLDFGTSKKIKQLTNGMYTWYILFQDGSMKTYMNFADFRRHNAFGLDGYAGSAVVGSDYYDSVNNVPIKHFPGFSFGDATPFVEFGQAVKKIGSYGSGYLARGRPVNGAGSWKDVAVQEAVPGDQAFNSVANHGSAHMCAIMQDDSLKCWGSNWAGQLGYEDYLDRGYEYDVTTTSGGVPTALGGAPTAENNVKDIPSVNVGTGRKVLDVCLGTANTCVVLDNYQVKCWGDNSRGQLGQGDRVRRGHEAGTMGDNMPFIDLGTGVKAVQVECYVGSVCVMTMDGQVKCWGQNVENEYGSGSVLPYGDLAKSSRGGSTPMVRDRGAGLGINFNMESGEEDYNYVEGMGDALPFVNFDCSDKDNSYVGISADKGTCISRTLPGILPATAARCGSEIVATVTTTVSLPLTVEQFDEDLQAEFVTAVAIVSKVRESQVTITKITGVSGRRRLLAESVEVETEVAAQEGQGLSKDSQLTTDQMTAYKDNSPNSNLPYATVLTSSQRKSVVAGKTIDFAGASSYAEATIAVEFDAVNFMEYGYASKYSYRIDNMIVMNFLGESSTQYDAILQKIARGEGFTVQKLGADDHYTLRPDFGENLLCDEVGDTSGIDTGQMNCFWRNAIVSNAVQPVAEESMYFYRKSHPADAQDATEWIRDTVLGGGSVFSENTAAEYFNRTCPGSRDPNAATRSYGCLYVDPGYRWVSRVRGGGGPTSPFTISDKTVVVAVVTIATEDGTVFRRRLLTADQDGTQSFDLPGSAVGDAAAPPAAAATHPRRLLAAPDPSLNLRDEQGSSSFVLNKYDVDADMSLAYLTGLKNQRWQSLEIGAVRGSNVKLDKFAGNVRSVAALLGARMGPHVHGVHCTGFASGASTSMRAAGDSSRRLLALPSPMNYTNVNISTIVRNGNNFGNIYVHELECALSALADTTELLSVQEVMVLVKTCERGSISDQLRGVLSMRLSTCGEDMSGVNNARCNKIRGVLAVMPGMAPPDTNQMSMEIPVLMFQLKLEMTLQAATSDSAVSDLMRQVVAEVLEVGTDRVLVRFAAAAGAAGGGNRRLLAVETLASVFVYKDTRMDGAVFKSGPDGVTPTAWAGARDGLNAAFSLMPALGVSSGGIVEVNRNPQRVDRPSLPTARMWAVPVTIVIDASLPLTMQQGLAVVSHLGMVLVAQFGSTVNAEDVSLTKMSSAGGKAKIRALVRSATKALAETTASEMEPMSGNLKDNLVLHLKGETEDYTLLSLTEEQVALDASESPFLLTVREVDEGEGGDSTHTSSGYGVVIAVLCSVAALAAAGLFWMWWQQRSKDTGASVLVKSAVSGSASMFTQVSLCEL